jgi:hypothetical protein
MSSSKATVLRIKALDASAIVTGVDSRFDMTVDGARINDVEFGCALE